MLKCIDIIKSDSCCQLTLRSGILSEWDSSMCSTVWGERAAGESVGARAQQKHLPGVSKSTTTYKIGQALFIGRFYTFGKMWLLWLELAEKIVSHVCVEHEVHTGSLAPLKCTDQYVLTAIIKWTDVALYVMIHSDSTAACVFRCWHLDLQLCPVVHVPAWKQEAAQEEGVSFSHWLILLEKTRRRTSLAVCTGNTKDKENISNQKLCSWFTVIKGYCRLQKEVNSPKQKIEYTPFLESEADDSPNLFFYLFLSFPSFQDPSLYLLPPLSLHINKSQCHVCGKDCSENLSANLKTPLRLTAQADGTW